MPNSKVRRPLLRPPKKGLQTALEAEVAQEVEALLGREALAELDFEALEVALRQRTLRLAAYAIEQRLNADVSDEASTHLRCPCGKQARYVARRTKNVVSVLGPLQLERAYYHCSRCGHGFCPRDEHLGIENTSLSPALTRMIGTVGAMVSFQEGSELLQDWSGWRWMPSRWKEPQKVWEKRSPKMNACTPNLWILFLCRRLCISVWMEQGFLYAQRNSWAARASNRMDPPRPAR